MEKTKSLRHVQLPHKDKNTDLNPQDQLVYMSIRRDMDKNTLMAHTSMAKIGSYCGASEPTIRKSIKKLVAANYLEVIRTNRENYYKFLKLTRFEPFSFEFLDNQNLTFKEKAYLLASQQFMFKNPETKSGLITLSARELGNEISMSHSSILRCQKTLEAKDVLKVVPTNAIDPETKCKKNLQYIYLDKIGQEIIFTLQEHAKQLKQQESKLLDHDKELEFLKEDNKALKKSNKALTHTVNTVLNQYKLMQNRIENLEKCNKAVAL